MVDKVFIIAEAGINHNGNFKTAKKLIFLSKKAGADAVKFQLFNTDYFINRDKMPKVYNRFKNLEFKYSEWQKLKTYAKKIKIKFFFSVFDEQSVALCKKMQINLIKVPSGEINNENLLKLINKNKCDVIVSTGMSSFYEIKNAVKILKNCNISLLHCLSEYPTKTKNLNLNFIKTLKEIPRISRIGFSDHSNSVVLPSVSVALGAKIIEKHFTHNKTLKLGDHKISLNFSEFKEMSENIRETSLALGGNKKIISKDEKKLSSAARKGLYAIKDIKVGEKLNNKNLGNLRHINNLNSINNINEINGRTSKSEILIYKEIIKNDLT